MKVLFAELSLPGRAQWSALMLIEVGAVGEELDCLVKGVEGLLPVAQRELVQPRVHQPVDVLRL